MRATELPWQELRGNLRAFIARRVRNEADVDDLVQGVLLQIVAGLDALRQVERLHAWVYRIARNAIADHYRSPVVRRERAGGDAVEIASAHDEAAGSAPIEEDDLSALRDLAACLPPMLRQLQAPYQDAIRMAELDGLTQMDAARRAGISVSGMKSRVQRARRQLRTMVEACCRVDLDRRGAIRAFASRGSARCGCHV